MNEAIMKAAIEIFNENGPRFTMDDLARRMRVSKRTIYENIKSKEVMISEIIEYVFSDIKEQEREIVADKDMELTEKIRKVICLQPRIPCSIDYNRVYEMQHTYPELYRKIDGHLTGEWEVTLSLFRQGISEGKLREVNLGVVRQVLLGAMRTLMEAEFLVSNHISYEDALNEALDIIMKGIVTAR